MVLSGSLVGVGGSVGGSVSSSGFPVGVVRSSGRVGTMRLALSVSVWWRDNGAVAE